MLCLANDISKNHVNDLLEQSGSMLNTRRALLFSIIIIDYSLVGTEVAYQDFAQTACFC